MTSPLVPLLLIALFSTLLADKSHANTTDTPWASPHPGQLLAKRWEDLSAREKKQVREAQKRYEKMPEDRKQQLRKKWENMPNKERSKYKLERRKR